MMIRPFEPGDAPHLRAVFFSSVHGLTSDHYTPQQQFAWAPVEYDAAAWALHLCERRPFVAEQNGSIVGYADLQPSGYIDHFYVAGAAARRGVGHALMSHLHEIAYSLEVDELHAYVSLTAEPFFATWGFQVEARRQLVVRGVPMTNASMRKRLEHRASRA